MRGFMKYACVLALPLLVAAGAAQAQTWPDGGNPSEGATLYDSCVPCHTLNGNGLAGKSVSDLMDKMKAYQSGTFTDAKLLGMQQVLKLIFPLSPNDMNDLCALYEKAGQINEIEADNIVHNERGCAFLISSPESRTNIRIVATPYFEKIFG